jgi:3-hydroxyisobutyrate dehydrogenase-like beta-hydroxyacid dehydrogenase
MAGSVFTVVATGEMGSALARALVDQGHRVLTSAAGRSQRTVQRAAQAGAETAVSLAAALAPTDVFLSVLPPDRALQLAEQVAAALPERDGGSLLYADCNAVSPATSARIGEVVTAAGARYVDVGIIGAPPRPVLYASGAHAGDLVDLAAGALDVRDIGGAAGRASALKMCYAAFTKGTTALATELLVAAQRLGVSEELRAELAQSAPDLLGIATRSVPRMPPKAYRWIGEMEEIAATFAAVGLTPRMLEGAGDMYRLVEAAGPPSGDLDQVVRVLSRGSVE